MGKAYFANSTAPLRGFTLVELVVVIVILAILSIYAVSSNLDSAEMTVPSQADRLASDIRLAQSLAFTSSSRVTVTATGTTYTVVCSGTGCSTTATSNYFPNNPVVLKKGIVFSGDSSGSVEFKSNGEPTQNATFFLELGGTKKKTVTVAALTGHVTVTP